jgi:acid phosphatase (class A)
VFFAAGLAAGILPLAPTLEAQQAAAPAQAASWHFVQTDKIDYARILPPPPAPGSLAAEADMMAVLQAQALRTYADESWARRVAIGDLFDYADVLGPWFSRANLPVTAALLENVDDDLGPGVDVSKATFARPRPFVVDARVHPCVGRPKAGGRFQGSYPSGHTMQFFVEAAVLARIFPDKREALFDLAGRMAWGRVIGGVHFPTDLVAGKLAAAAIVAELDKSPAYQADLAQAQAEAGKFLAKRQAGP